jgi:hypothetical protein
MKNAIVMLSIGRRPWASAAFATFERYAERVGSDAIFVTEPPSILDFDIGDMTKKPGRTNKSAYALKSFIPWSLMQNDGFDRILMVDDTCVIHPYAGNIFDDVPNGKVGYTKTTGAHARTSFDYISNSKFVNDEINFNEDFYGNSGVVLYDKSSISAFSPTEIVEHKDLLYCTFPHQTLFYYLLQKHKVDTHILPKKYNLAPALNIPNEERRNLLDISEHISLDTNFIMHFTGAYRNREELIKQTAGIYIDLWNKEAASNE